MKSKSFCSLSFMSQLLISSRAEGHQEWFVMTVCMSTWSLLHNCMFALLGREEKGKKGIFFSPAGRWKMMRFVMGISSVWAVILQPWPGKVHSEWVLFFFKLISDIWFHYLVSKLKEKRSKPGCGKKFWLYPAAREEEGKGTEEICLSFYKILRLY